jgi:hypothetical protein
MSDVAAAEAQTEAVAVLAPEAAPEAIAPPAAPSLDEPVAPSAEVPAGDTGEAASPEAAAAVEIDAAPASAEAPAERIVPEIEHAIGATRQSILDEFLDSDRAELSMSEIKRALPNVPPGTIEACVRREWQQGRLLRVSPGTYRLAPPRPAEPPKLAPQPAPLPEDEATWFDALERWIVERSSWDVEKLGPPPDARDNRIPSEVRMRFNDRNRKRQERRREAEAAAAKRSAADAELRDKLLQACNQNYAPSLQVADLAPIREVLKVLPLDQLVMVIKQKVDRRAYPANPPLVSWSDPAFLGALAEAFCRLFAIPGLVKEWGNAGRAPAAKAPSSPAAGEMPDDNIDRSYHDDPSAPPGPHNLPKPDAAPSAPDTAQRSRRGSLAVHEARDRISELGRHTHYCCRSVAGATPNIRYYGCGADQPLTS